jgi:hypothetical protein
MSLKCLYLGLSQNFYVGVGFCVYDFIGLKQKGKEKKIIYS